MHISRHTCTCQHLNKFESTLCMVQRKVGKVGRAALVAAQIQLKGAERTVYAYE